MYEDILPGSLEGEMTVAGLQKPVNSAGKLEFNTLDEPIRDTVVCEIEIN